MADTTKANVLLIAPALSAVTDQAVWDIILADVAEEILETDVCKYQEQIQRYLAAHLMTVATGIGLSGSSAVGGTVTREKVGDLEVEYNGVGTGGGLETTKYGLEYIRLRNKYRKLRVI
jgi:hypothetical protein